MNSFSMQDAPGNGKGATPQCPTYRCVYVLDGTGYVGTANVPFQVK